MSLAANLLSVIIGISLIAAVCVDIFLTVLHPAIESPLSNRLQQLLWQGLRGIDHLLPAGARRSWLLELGLPLMVAGLIVMWLFVLGVGFACLYYPWIADPAAFNTSNPPQGALFDALYFSGVTLATLGYGDIQPLMPALRTLAVVEAVLGAITVSAGVAYILAVYPALTQQRTIARALNAEVAGQTSALPMLRRYLAADGNWHADLFTQLRQLAIALLEMSESHETHSVLYYARPRYIQHSFLRVLLTAQSLVANLRYSLSVERHPDTVNHPHLLLLEQSLHYTLHQLGASIHLAKAEPQDDGGQPDQLLTEHRQRCRELDQIGLASVYAHVSKAVAVLVHTDAETDDDPAIDTAIPNGMVGSLATDTSPNTHDPALDDAAQSPEAAYLVFRQQTDPRIAAYAAACGYTLADARADVQTIWWTGRAHANIP